MANDAVESAVPTAADGLASGLQRRANHFVTLLDLKGRGLFLLVALLVVAWVMSGIYKVQPDEQGVVLRFGRWIGTALPGLHYHLPYPIETVLLPKVTQVHQLQLGGASGGASAGTASDPAATRDKQMLTGDENIVEADCTVFWQIKDAGQYLFRIDDPERSVRIAAESALREVIGRTPIQAAMSDKRAQIADATRTLLQQLLDRAGAGILVTQVQLQRVDPPAQVIDAFNDVQRARADQERARNDAESYANDILPRARGDAARLTQEANAYRQQVTNLAEGEARRFQSIEDSYAQHKDVTAWRMYLESMDEVLKKATRVVVQPTGSTAGATTYLPLPLDKGAPKATGKDGQP